MDNLPTIKNVISEVLTLLFSSEKKEAIDKALKLLLDYFNTDWVYVAYFEKEHLVANFLYEVTSRWVDTSKEDASELSYETIPWMIDTIIAGKDIILHDIDDLPANAHADRKLFQGQGLQSLLAIPLTFHEKIQGFIGFDSVRIKRHWSLSEVEDLHIIANIFSIILERQYTHQEAEQERRKSELELQKVREADLLKSAFLANMSHEIRTPLNAIVGFSNIMAETDDAEERRNFQDIINKNNDLLLQLISDILDFSKIESGVLSFQKANMDLKEICSEVAILYTTNPNPASSIKFIYDASQHSEISLYTDAQRVIQVLSNLITNAYKFTHTGSITLSYRIENKKVRISVRDTGIGIAPKYHNEIFQRFIKVDNFSQGTGLGLPICKTIIEALDGEIGMCSKSGEGSTFWFTLPLPFSDK